MNETHLAVILDLLKNGEIDETKATAAIRRMAEHQYLIDTTDENKFRQLLAQVDPTGLRENHHYQWSKEDIATLIQLRKSGVGFEEIGRKLKRTTRGVRSRWAFEQLVEKQNRLNSPPSSGLENP
jgi:hypothetical protein